ncbi:peptidase M48 Ste24p [Thioalkalivibrio sulfidiphilus HL-EbGr7]|uniref:Peptidase M48 Ste24p n=1 Tax=Thioalkalivibrio sulfidiphilus (strain HL-EbGR7) TaxID=396588 RepID=B8GPM8_THISH|nr:zinc metalloprotease HtpX [Thioalkalivibrio sulfidiphilus]ACL72195.1 peptidase M48 Ste24p [Thioalkalivibrio sulfidiphilus HL-EbGr7]
MDPLSIARHRWVNALQTALLVLGLMVLLGAVGWLVGGPGYALMAIAVVVVLYLFNPAMSPALVMRLYRAQRLDARTARVPVQILQELSERAGLPGSPALYYVPSRLMNAFSVGDRREAAVAVSDGLLRGLDTRGLVAVLAHEVSHIAHNDLRTMTFADLASRLTGLLSLVGQFLLLVNLPLLILGEQTISWFAIALLIFAPTLSALFQLALSRSREYQADLGAARLTGDPEGLALALARLERVQGGWIERVLMPGWRIPEPSWLRTHPSTEERIARLMQLEQTMHRAPLSPGPYDPAALLRQDLPRPRWRIGGTWF